MAEKLKWKVGSKLTGQYRSFSHRAWPHAEVNGHSAFYIACADSYDARLVERKLHGPLTVYVAKYVNPAERKEKGHWQWLKFKRQFDSLDDAKEAAEAFWKTRGDFFKYMGN